MTASWQNPFADGAARELKNSLRDSGLLDMREKLLYSAMDLSGYLGRSVSTIYRMAETGEIPSFKRKGLGLRFRKEEIDKWINESSRKSLDFVSWSSDPRRLYNLQTTLNESSANGITPSGGVSEMPKGKTKSRLNLGYGAIYQRKTKQGIIRWYLDYRDENSKRVQGVAKASVTQEDAIRELRQRVLDVLNRLTGGGIKRIGFREFAKAYLQGHLMTKRRNWASDKFRLNKLEGYFDSIQDLREITPLMIGGLIKSRQEAGNAGSTINRFLALLKHLLNKAIEEGYLEGNPATKVKLFRETNRIERVLSQDEEKRLLAHSCGYLRSILIIALNTGARLGEILRLQWKEIDLDAGRISILQTKAGKPRNAFINTPLLHELERMRSENGKKPFLFFNEETGRPRKSVAGAFQSACKKAGVENFRVHDCRHTFISRLLEKGVDVETVRSLAGHSSLAMVQRYAHSRDELKKKAVELLSQEPGRSPEKGGDVLRPCDTDRTKENASAPTMPLDRSFSWS